MKASIYVRICYTQVISNHLNRFHPAVITSGFCMMQGCQLLDSAWCKGVNIWILHDAGVSHAEKSLKVPFYLRIFNRSISRYGRICRHECLRFFLHRWHSRILLPLLFLKSLRLYYDRRLSKGRRLQLKKTWLPE